jgi:hypothetical protein
MLATISMPWAFIVALWHVEDPTMGAYIATTGVATYAPPARSALVTTRKTSE